MIIGYDASRAFTKKRTGVENYSYHLLLALANLKCKHQFVAYLRNSRELFLEKISISLTTSHLPHLTSKVINWPFFWTQAGLALETWLYPPDLLFIPAHTLPFLKNPKVKTVVAVHDLWTHDLPQSQNPIQRMYLNLNMERLRARLATHLIAVSQSTKKDIIELLGVPEERVSVVYEGVEHRRYALKVRNQRSEIRRILRKYGVGERYLLFVGTIQPRKNLVRLIEAFSKITNRHELETNLHELGKSVAAASYAAKKAAHGAAATDLQLILAGQRGWMANEIYTAPVKFGVGERVKFIDYAEDDDLPYLYAGAYALVMPSLHEGFGLPVLEAMACGTPVVISRTSSLPEVAGNVGIYVNAESIESIANGILAILKMEAVAYQQLSQKCIAQAQKFSWEKCAQETLKVFEKVLAI